VAVLENGAASFAKCFDALVDRARDETDEAAGDEDAGERDEQSQDPRPPTAVTCERPGADDPQHRLPERLTERQAVPVVHAPQSGDRQDDRRDRDDDQGEQTEPADHDRRATRERRVEPVTEPLAQGMALNRPALRLTLCHNLFAHCRSACPAKRQG